MSRPPVAPGLILLALVSLSLPVVAWAQAEPPPHPRAAPHVEAAARYFQAGNYAEAAKEFRAAHELDPQPRFLYAVAQAQRLGGDYRAALRTYEAFLKTRPPRREAESAQQNMARCVAALKEASPPATPEGDVAAPPAPGATPPRVPASPPPPARAPASRPSVAPSVRPDAAVVPPLDRPRRASDRVPWYKDVLGDTLCLGGIVALAAGGAFWGVGRDHLDSAGGATSYGSYSDRVVAAHAWQAAGAATMSVGGALLVAGIVRFLLRRPTSTRPAVVTMTPVVRGGGVTLTTGF
jgi:tetratricopeptide (TPR) repeat protein